MATDYSAIVWGRVLPLDTFDPAAILDFYEVWGERTNPEPQCAPTPSASPGTSPSASPSGSPSASPSVVTLRQSERPRQSQRSNPSASPS